MKRLVAIVLCLALPPIVMSVSKAWADDSDIFGATVQPNVMLLLDTSGSMAWGIPSFAYNPNATYPLRQMCRDLESNCQTNYVYKGMGIHPNGWPRYIQYATSIASVTNADARAALTSTGYWFGTISGSQVHLYRGKYLNYLYCTTCTGSETRINVAKQVLTNLINNVERVRFGVMTFKQTGAVGGRMVSPIGTAKATMINAINNVVADGGTPLGGQLRDAGLYYKGAFGGYESPIQDECQPNFVIMITDGMQTDIAANGAVAGHASTLYNDDHATWLPGKQNVKTYTVGFALVSGEDVDAIPALEATAQNGHGAYKTANNAADLERVLLEAIQNILQGTFAFATPTIPTTSATGISRAYMAAFKTNPSAPYWRGYLKAYNRNSSGLAETDANGKPREDAACTVPDPDHEGQTLPCFAWEAGRLLETNSSRTIYTATAVNGSLESFSASIDPQRLGLSAGDTSNRDRVVDVVFNGITFVDADDEDGDGDETETRRWRLGDIYHSTPVVVTRPFLPSQEQSYTTFRTTWASRTPILLVGSNDGMLHAFRESDGAELWAFIPPDILPRLKELTQTMGNHPYLVDGSPIAADVKIGAQMDTARYPWLDATNAWRTIVVFGERRGGKHYHALDITDTANPHYLWSYTNDELLETWSEPVIGKVKVSGGDKYVAIFGGGYDTANNNQHGRGVFVVDLANGEKLWEYKTPAAPGAISTTTCNASTTNRNCMNYSIAASPLALDLDADGYIDRVYIGDIGGQLWKIDLSKRAQLSGSPPTAATCADATSSDCWMGKRFFRAGDPSNFDANPPADEDYYPSQPIYSAPNATYDANRDVWIYFGTGDRNHPRAPTSDSDASLKDQNRFYGIKDTTTMAHEVLTESNLTNVTTLTGTITQGWYFTLDVNEKVLAQPDVFNKVVFFTTFTPETTATCGGGGGASKLYAVDMTTGYAAIDWSHSTTTVVVYTTQTASNAARSKSIGTGIPSKPMVIITDAGATLTTSVIAATTNQQLPNNPAPPPDNMRRILYWREAF